MVRIGVLWDEEIDHSGEKPFRSDELNFTYSYLSEKAGVSSGKVFLSDFEAYEGGVLDRAYCWQEGEWKRREKVSLDVVLDKYRFDPETEVIKRRMSQEIPVLNPFRLEKLCKDKLETSKMFPALSPETDVADPATVEEFIESYGEAVIKPNHGFGGKDVVKIDSIEQFDPGENLIVQEPVRPSGDVPEIGYSGYHDFRVLLLSGDVVASYFRVNDADFRANMSQGASKEYVDIDSMPETVRKHLDVVVSRLDAETYFISADFMFDEDNTPVLIELNSKPGLTVDSEVDWKGRRHVLEAVADTLVDMGEV